MRCQQFKTKTGNETPLISCDLMGILPAGQVSGPPAPRPTLWRSARVSLISSLHTWDLHFSLCQGPATWFQVLPTPRLRLSLNTFQPTGCQEAGKSAGLHFCPHAVSAMDHTQAGQIVWQKQLVPVKPGLDQPTATKL